MITMSCKEPKMNGMVLSDEDRSKAIAVVESAIFNHELCLTPLDVLINIWLKLKYCVKFYSKQCNAYIIDSSVTQEELAIIKYLSDTQRDSIQKIVNQMALSVRKGHDPYRAEFTNRLSAKISELENITKLRYTKG